ncbi:MAG: TonB-dependent receptor [Porphyromonadaceae bacterium]|nr:TonB-dependent receptor [Porphyromonadaceae bacterium]
MKKVLLKLDKLVKIPKLVLITCFLLGSSLISFAENASYSQTTALTIKMDNKTIKDVFNYIEKNSEFIFVYYDYVIDTKRLVDVNVQNQPITTILNQIFKGTDVTYTINNRQVIIKKKENAPVISPAQQQGTEVSGIVTDNAGDPIIGANIIIKGSNTGVITDMDGRYVIKVPSSKSILVVSYIGFTPQEISVGNKTILNVVLASAMENLDEVVVVGYGTQKKVNLTGSVLNVTSKDLVKRSASNTSVALQGLAPGVSVVTTSGRPGYDGAGITIRGTGSLNSSSSPLVLIDGVEGYMNFLDMNTIESISVLKDAASASIYGSRASNGVILVTTKRAKEQPLKVTYNGYVGYNTPTDLPDPANAIEYMEAINLANSNAGANQTYSDELIGQYKTLGADNINRYETNWRKEVIKDIALTHNHSVSVTGGSKDVSVFANAAYYYQDGNIANNSYDRMTLRLNTDARITDWMTAGVNVNIRQSKSINPALDSPESIICKATTFVPIFSGINDDGTWGYGQNGDNPIATAKASGIGTSRSPELGLKGFVTIKPFKGFDMTASYSSNRLETKGDSFLKPYDTYEYGVFKTSFPASGTSKYEGWSQSMSNEFNVQASYEKQIKGNNFKVLGGMQTSEKSGRSFSATRTGFDFTGFEDLNNGDISTASNAGSHWNWTMLSYYSRINYNFKDRYLVELNGRWDASSRFMKDQRWGFFPSASLGWRVSEEPFFEPVKRVVNNLKFRGSYGTLGNQDISINGYQQYYPYAATIGSGYGYWFNEVLGSGATQTQVANEKISWEKSTQMNVGLDADFLNSKLTASFDYYVRDINDMLQQFPIPLYVGLSSSWENAGSMRNNGWDFTLTWRDKVGNVNYNITGNLSDVKNTVTNLYGKEYVGTQITREGDALGSWYGYLSDGYFQTQEEIDASPVYGTRANIKPGFIKYKDISGPDGVADGIVNDFDRSILGNPSPRYEFSLNLGAEWNNFDFSMFFQGVGKKELFYSSYGARPFYIGRSIMRNQLDTWTPENTDAAFPLLLIDGSGSNVNNIISDFWVKSGAYMRLKNVVIGYTLPKTLTQKMKIDNLRFYVSGQNLFTLSDAYEGYDPEASVSSGSFYPLMQTFTFGMDIRF